MLKIKNEKAKILYIDIEATNLSASMGYILAIGYKWAHEKKAHVLRIDATKEYKKKRTDDTGLLKQFEPVFNEADVVVHHFGDYYDIPFIQTRRIIKGLKRLPDVATVDTWRIARKKLRFHSNRLEAILQALECPIQKTPVKGDVWIDAMAGFSKSIDYVVDHCLKDILVLEWVYNKLAPMWPCHPNVNKDREHCAVCGGASLQSQGIRVTRVNRYQRLRCKDCGHTMKGRKL